jgi:hypothetical protein
MKTQTKRRLVLTAILILAALFSFTFLACSDVGLGGAGGGTGTITLNPGGSSRSVLNPTDAQLDVMIFEIEFSGHGSVIERTARGRETVSATVAAGLWHIRIDAYLDNELYAIGRSSVTVIGGQANPVTVAMRAPEDLCALGHDINWLPTYNSVNDNICKRSGCDHIATIGDRGPGGGIIYYVDTGGFTVQGFASQNAFFDDTIVPNGYTAHYLEAAPADSGNTQWGGLGTFISGLTNPPFVSDPLASQIGNGRKDTQLIIARLAGLIPPDTGAANFATTANFGNKTDWFLPSTGELNMLWVNKDNAVITNLLPNSYWSSSTQDNSSAWRQFFDNGNRGGSNRSATSEVRLIRAF